MRPKVILFGDSITEESFTNGGWGAALADHFSRKADVVLRGYSGYNTRWALKVAARALDGVCEDGEWPLALTVFFGANDASIHDRSSGFQHVPLDEYQSNLRSILSFFKERWPTTVIVLITPPPIDEDGRLRNPFGDDPSGLPERTNDSAGAYAKACIAVAAESNIPVIDIWSKIQEFYGWEKSFLRSNFERRKAMADQTNKGKGIAPSTHGRQVYRAKRNLPANDPDALLQHYKNYATTTNSDPQTEETMEAPLLELTTAQLLQNGLQHRRSNKYQDYEAIMEALEESPITLERFTELRAQAKQIEREQIFYAMKEIGTLLRIYRSKAKYCRIRSGGRYNIFHDLYPYLRQHEEELTAINKRLGKLTQDSL